MKDRWTVVNEYYYDKGVKEKLRNRLFGKDLSEYYDEEQLKDVEVVPYEEWIAEDFVEILGGEYENSNYHNFVNIPNIILDVIRERDYTEAEENALVKLICEAMYEEI